MEHDSKTRNLILVLGLALSLIVLVSSYYWYLDYQHSQMMSLGGGPGSGRGMMQQTSTVFIPSLAFIGVLLATFVYYVMSGKAEKTETKLEKNTRIILKFLSREEQKVIDTLLAGGGKVQQYELTHLPDMNKVKTHRIISNLEAKGIIAKEKLGKVNRIVLNDELYEVLKE